MTVASRRHSKYSEAVHNSLAHFGHATNAQLADDLRRSYPHISDTTVHRVTHRLYEDGVIGFATLDRSGVMVYDARTSPHDHFYCEQCDKLRDISVSSACRSAIKQSIGPCELSESLKIVGRCRQCIDNT